ncbi:hypothetical protein MKW94_028090, partial [Papaver nudicaule]|nr:hypothetical protein [Papaver nudicaule]
MGDFWHPECFCCRACSQPITENEVRCRTFLCQGENPYHKSCFKELHHPKWFIHVKFHMSNSRSQQMEL